MGIFSKQAGCSGDNKIFLIMMMMMMMSLFR